MVHLPACILGVAAHCSLQPSVTWAVHSSHAGVSGDCQQVLLCTQVPVRDSGVQMSGRNGTKLRWGSAKACFSRCPHQDPSVLRMEVLLHGCPVAEVPQREALPHGVLWGLFAFIIMPQPGGAQGDKVQLPNKP